MPKCRQYLLIALGPGMKKREKGRLLMWSASPSSCHCDLPTGMDWSSLNWVRINPSLVKLLWLVAVVSAMRIVTIAYTGRSENEWIPVCISDTEEIARERSDSLGVREYIYRARGHGSKSMETVLRSGWPAEIKEDWPPVPRTESLFFPLSLEIAGKGRYLALLDPENGWGSAVVQ